MAEWVRALACTGGRTVRDGFESHCEQLRFGTLPGNSVYPALPVSFGGDTKSRRSLLSGVYARGSKISHHSALECVIVVDSTTHSKKTPHLQSAIMRLKTLPCTCIGRRRRNRKKSPLGFKHSSPKLENRVPHKSTSWCHCLFVELIQGLDRRWAELYRGSVNYPLQKPRITTVEKV